MVPLEMRFPHETRREPGGSCTEPAWVAWLRAEVLAEAGFHYEAIVLCDRALRSLSSHPGGLSPGARRAMRASILACKAGCLDATGNTCEASGCREEAAAR